MPDSTARPVGATPRPIERESVDLGVEPRRLVEPARTIELVETRPDAERVQAPLDVARIRADFPILTRRVGEWPLAYLDSANTSQKPKAVVEAIATHYLEHNANVARAMHTLGGEATEAFEGARNKVANFIGARAEEVVFTKNASEALNLAAHTLGARLQPGDEIVISVLEHHSNIVPWQMLAERTGATLRWFDITGDGRLDLDALDDGRDPMLDLDERTGREVGAAPRSGREPGPVQVRTADRHGVRIRCCGASGSTGCTRARLVERARVVDRIARRRAPVGSPENDISPAGVVGVAIGDVVLDREGRAAVELGGHRVREAERLGDGLDAHLLGKGGFNDGPLHLLGGFGRG